MLNILSSFVMKEVLLHLPIPRIYHILQINLHQLYIHIFIFLNWWYEFSLYYAFNFSELQVLQFGFISCCCLINLDLLK